MCSFSQTLADSSQSHAAILKTPRNSSTNSSNSFAKSFENPSKNYIKLLRIYLL